ncbi:hypothetical protein AVEN_144655-1, partial [Araneus ventricosus]
GSNTQSSDPAVDSSGRHRNSPLPIRPSHNSM